MKFKKKPVVIEAYQFDGTYTGMEKIKCHQIMLF